MNADAYNVQEWLAKRLTPTHVTELTEFWQGMNELKVDGRCGSKTRASLESELSEIGEPQDQDDVPRGTFDGPLDFIPSNRREVYDLFGDPGTKARPNRKWRKENIITVRDLPGVPPKWHFKVHRLAEPYMREGLRRAEIASDYQVERAGCFVLRHIQHNPAKPLSLHSWGIAVDVDPEFNFARRLKRGEGPTPWTDEWNAIWPRSVDHPFVEAMESAGFTWGGVWGRSGDDFAERAARASYFDPMHFELRVRG